MRLSVADDNARPNGFDGLRLLAAVAVVGTHASVLTGHGPLAVQGETPSHVGVGAFFAISGFLVTRSWCRDPALGAFAWKRALRLLPALMVTTFATAYVLGPFITALPAADYLSRAQTHRFVFGNWVMWSQWHLPGVFASTLRPDQVNGSLWTISVEARCYLAIALLGATGLLRAGGWRLLAAGAAALTAARLVPFPAWPVGASVLAWGYGGTFAAASAMYLARDRIPLGGRWCAAALALFAVTLAKPSLHLLLTPLLLSYVVLWLAYRRPRLGRLARPGDASYGLYLTAFPLQQLVATFSRSAVLDFVIAAPAAYVLGLGLWRFVERPCLRLKTRFAAPSAPLPAAAPSG